MLQNYLLGYSCEHSFGLKYTGLYLFKVITFTTAQVKIQLQDGKLSTAHELSLIHI